MGIISSSEKAWCAWQFWGKQMLIFAAASQQHCSARQMIWVRRSFYRAFAIRALKLSTWKCRAMQSAHSCILDLDFARCMLVHARRSSQPLRMIRFDKRFYLARCGPLRNIRSVIRKAYRVSLIRSLAAAMPNACKKSNWMCRRLRHRCKSDRSERFTALAPPGGAPLHQRTPCSNRSAALPDGAENGPFFTGCGGCRLAGHVWMKIGKRARFL